ncbi:MAG: hypothetical protein R3284_04350 [Rubricoccaceae bacterium]|nr:hypothetical protein [Rubricoccaceae bacterium]
MNVIRPVLLLLVASAFIWGCAPSVTPLYRDYEVNESHPTAQNEADVYDRIRTALEEAGWTETEADVPNVVSTEPRWSSSWAIFRIEVSLDVVPIGDEHVRILFHPTRHSILGGRTKIPYLDGGMRRRYLEDLNEAFAAQGFEVLGTAKERDEENVEG